MASDFGFDAVSRNAALGILTGPRIFSVARRFGLGVLLRRIRSDRQRVALLAYSALAGGVDRLTDWLLHRIAVPLGRKRTVARLAQGRPSSLWGVTPILTLPLKARADRLLGFRSHSLVFVTYYITQNFDFNLERVISYLHAKRPSFVHAFHRLLLAWALWRYDVFHLFYDKGLLEQTTRFGINLHELDILRTAGKRVYLYAYGADVRLRKPTLRLGRWNFCADCVEPGRFCACDETENAPIMKAMCEKVTRAVALGDMLVYVPNVLPLHYWPIDMSRLPAAPARSGGGALRIAHAPNHSHFKGSQYLVEAVDRLRNLGHLIEYVTIQGVPNTEVLRLFSEVDIVADQFIGGAYGYTALEAMALGKPVMTYVRSPDLVEAVEECPLINVNPDTIDVTLAWCLAHRAELDRIGAQGRAYVMRWHTVEAVAARFGRMYVETANFPDASAEKIHAFLAIETERRLSIPLVADWQHPFQVTKSLP